jgi:hypothetical protein
MKLTLNSIVALCFLASIFSLTACSTTDDDTPIVDNTNSDELPEVFQKFSNVEDVYVEGEYVVIKTKGMPDHKSPYYKDTQWHTEKYEDYNGDNPLFHLNPNRISEQNLTFKIPLLPTVDNNHSATPFGAIGVTVNGVALFNQYAAGGDNLEQEINSFDQHEGHPQQSGMYHYHIEPTYLTDTKGQEALMGFLLDGFPVYGPYENGQEVKNSDLDAYHGHNHATLEYPEGIYHYHFTSEDPYLNGDGFYGEKGTVSN